jgi:two-component system sensor histidine kinase KdpD
MILDWTPDRRRLLIAGTSTVLALILSTGLVWLLEQRFGVPNASSAYLLAVVAIAVAYGTVAATATAVGAFLAYDFLFTQPLYTFTVADPEEWVNVVLLLVVGIVVGQLAAAQRRRAEAAELRERESRLMFQVSRAMALRETTPLALGTIVNALRQEARLERCWIELGDQPAGSAVADTDPGSLRPQPATYATLIRTPGDEPARWIRVHQSSSPGRRLGGEGGEAYRVAIEAGGRVLGALWAVRTRTSRAPSREETRILAGAADQIGQALEQDRLRGEATSAELARRSDALKTALLESVSHDLRTPLASIRAAAGSLMDRDVRWSTADRLESATVIDREAERLNRLVTNLLDMSRIEAGDLRGDAEPYPIDDVVATTIDRLARQPDHRRIEVAIPPDLPLVEIDPVFMDEILANVLDNALKYAPPDTPIRVTSALSPNGEAVRLVVEDGGFGVPADSLSQLFEKFYRVPSAGQGAQRGTGIGLAVVRGLVQSMGGRVTARRSALGGLAVEIDLPLAVPYPGTVSEPTIPDVGPATAPAVIPATSRNRAPY